MLTTSTHDTKFSEDARARLFALAELPDEWESHLTHWHRINSPARKVVDGKSGPDSREEYLLYQALLAGWPLGCTKSDDNFRQRFKSYFRKAQGEAKLNTSWTFPHEAWHAAGDAFVDALLDSAEFMNSFLPFATRIAERGMIFSLAQTVLRLTCPGVPDLYQGNEIWDFSLVDPDNRRPVDFKARIDLLGSLDSRTPRDLMENWRDGGIKMHVIRSLLRCRQNLADLFIRGEYRALTSSGPDADRVVAFLRRLGPVELLVVVPRRLGPDAKMPFTHQWSDTQLVLNEPRDWTNLLSGQKTQQRSNSIKLDEIFANLPVAVLLSE